MQIAKCFSNNSYENDSATRLAQLRVSHEKNINSRINKIHAKRSRWQPTPTAESKNKTEGDKQHKTAISERRVFGRRRVTLNSERRNIIVVAFVAYSGIECILGSRLSLLCV